MGQRSAELAARCRQRARRQSAPGTRSACGKVPTATMLLLPVWSTCREGHGKAIASSLVCCVWQRPEWDSCGAFQRGSLAVCALHPALKRVLRQGRSRST